AQTGITDFGNRGEFTRFPIAQGIGGNRIEDARNRSGHFGVGRVEEMPRYQQFSQKICDDHMPLPFPSGAPSSHQAQKLMVLVTRKSRGVQRKFGVFVPLHLLMPKLKPWACETKTGYGQMPLGSWNVGAGFAHVHHPDFSPAPQGTAALFMRQFAFTGLNPKK